MIKTRWSHAATANGFRNVRIHCYIKKQNNEKKRARTPRKRIPTRTDPRLVADPAQLLVDLLVGAERQLVVAAVDQRGLLGERARLPAARVLEGGGAALAVVDDKNGRVPQHRAVDILDPLWGQQSQVVDDPGQFVICLIKRKGNAGSFLVDEPRM